MIYYIIIRVHMDPNVLATFNLLSIVFKLFHGKFICFHDINWQLKFMTTNFDESSKLF